MSIPVLLLQNGQDTRMPVCDSWEMYDKIEFKVKINTHIDETAKK